jgi:hypothetical protein
VSSVGGAGDRCGTAFIEAGFFRRSRPTEPAALADAFDVAALTRRGRCTVGDKTISTH